MSEMKFGKKIQWNTSGKRSGWKVITYEIIIFFYLDAGRMDSDRHKVEKTHVKRPYVSQLPFRIARLGMAGPVGCCYMSFFSLSRRAIRSRKSIFLVFHTMPLRIETKLKRMIEKVFEGQRMVRVQKALGVGSNGEGPSIHDGFRCRVCDF